MIGGTYTAATALLAGKMTQTPHIPSPLFAAWARFVLRRRLALATLLVGLTVGALLQMRRLSFDTSIEAFASDNEGLSKTLEEFRDEFGRDDVFLILVQGDVFTADYATRIKALDDEISALNMEIPSLGERKRDRDRHKNGQPTPAAKPASSGAENALADGFADDEGWGDETGGSIIDEVISIVTARRTEGNSEGFHVGKLMDPMPTSPEEFERLRQRVLGDRSAGIPPDPTLIGHVVNATGTASAIVVRTQFMSEMDSERVHQKLKQILVKYDKPEFKTHVAGLPAIAASLNALMLQDMSKSFAISVVVLVSMLLFMFRHLTGVLGPLIVVLLSIIWSMGLMATIGLPMTMLTTILPAFVICVGVADSVHLQSVYRDGRREGLANEEAIVAAMSSTARPVLFTSLTTATGLLSFLFADVTPVKEMGVAGAIAVALACFHTLLFLPIVLSLNRKSLLGRRADGRHDRIDSFLRFFAGLSRSRRRAVLLLLGALACTALSLVGVARVRVWHNPMTWLPPDRPIRTASDLADRELGGVGTLQLLVRAKGEQGVKDAALLHGLQQLESHILAFRQPDTGEKLAGNAQSALDAIRETNRALHGGKAEHWKLPDNQRTLAEEFFLFENSSPEQLRRLVTVDAKKMQMTVRIKWMPAGRYAAFSRHIEDGIARYMPKDKAEVETTGSVPQVLSTVGSLLGNILRSFGVAFAVITLLLVFMLRSVKLGLVAMVPNLFPILFLLGVMGLTGIPIDLFNMMIASIALGIAVDDTIHFLHQFRVHYDRNGHVEGAISHTLQHSGRALVVTSVILTGGFMVFIGASMYAIQRFGALISASIVLALLLDVSMTPALIRLVYCDRTPAVMPATGAIDV